MLVFIVFVIAVVAFAFALKSMNEVAALRTRLDALEGANAAALRRVSPPLAPEPEPTRATSPPAAAAPPPLPPEAIQAAPAMAEQAAAPEAP
ncbi:hypothetical protein CWO89_45670, partial [Bradyrhizobium sp. Leo170]